MKNTAFIPSLTLAFSPAVQRAARPSTYLAVCTACVLAFIVLLAGCATPADTQAAYDAHIAAFDREQPNTRHTVKRTDLPGGWNISAREFNPARRGVAPTLVLMHGFPDNQHLYDAVIPMLARTHHVVSFDFLGWGDSDKPPGHNYEVASQRADLDAVIQHFGLTSTVIVVHDLSGHVGIDWALDNEAQTAAVVLLNTYYNAMPSLKAPEAIQTYSTPGAVRDLIVWGSNKSATRFKDGVASQIGRFFSNAQSRQRYVPVLTHSASEIRPAFISSTAALWPEIAAREKNLPRMANFNKPVIIIFGADDPYLNPGVAAEFQRQFPRSRLSLVKAAGHYVQLDQADEVARLMLDGLSKTR